MAAARVSCVYVALLFIVLSSAFTRDDKFSDTSELYPFDFFARADWKAQTPTGLTPLHQPVPYVVIHHTYIPGACSSFKECGVAMRSMQSYHMGMNWGDIGYNFCVGSEGGSYEGRGWDHSGIHAGPANNHSIGICLIGDWRAEVPPRVQLDTVKSLIHAGVRLGKIDKNYKLIGHAQAMRTECPGSALMREISSWPHYDPSIPDFKSIRPQPVKREVLEKWFILV